MYGADVTASLPGGQDRLDVIEAVPEDDATSPCTATTASTSTTPTTPPGKPAPTPSPST